MPEGPEVRRMAEGLAKRIVGNRVVHEVTEDGRMTHWVPEIQS